MTQGFYEQLGVEPDASAGQVRAAWAAAVGRLARRRKALTEQGGEAATLDLTRTRLDEALAVLGDPARRRRYDAMLRWVAAAPGDGEAARRNDPESLWGEVSDALVSPAVAAAIRLLRATTRLDLTEVATAQSAGEEPPTLVPADEDLTSPRVAKKLAPTPEAPVRPRPSARVVPLPGVPPVAAAPPPGPQLVVVEGHAAPVVVMPKVERAVSAEDIARLVDRHGYGGALLRAVREARGPSLQDVAATTRISVRYLEAIEADAFDQLPSATFVRGYVREVARLLRLDETAVVAGYMKRLAD
jgi:hypothetical protein